MTDEGFANPPEYNDPPPPLTRAALDSALSRMGAANVQVLGEGATPLLELVGVPAEIQQYAFDRFRETMMAADPDLTARDAGAEAGGFVLGLIAARLAADYE